MHSLKQWAETPKMVDERLIKANNVLYIKYHLSDEHPNVTKEKNLFLVDQEELFSSEIDGSELYLFTDYDPNNMDYNFVDKLANFYSLDDVFPFFVVDYSLPDFYPKSYDLAGYDFGQYNFLDTLLSYSTAKSLTIPYETADNNPILMNHDPLKTVFYDTQVI